MYILLPQLTNKAVAELELFDFITHINKYAFWQFLAARQSIFVSFRLVYQVI